ncbi:retinoid-inducible serine carboxypeptidase-like [Tubulanus polymorphus]|uniref:retinoid-inducible serine carboxypeptidase-like n=1 Tax=Tubulanus polymorphus TaxID=672921 RepID=UPI003DA1E97F
MEVGKYLNRYIFIFSLLLFKADAEPTHPIKEFTTVRPGVHLHSWLYLTAHPEGFNKRPLILWLSGGPGQSSIAIGNFLQIGPYDGDLNQRDTSWAKYCSVLFVDSPVGTGFSYADGEHLFTSDVFGVVTDLLEYLRQFFSVKHPEFKGLEFYIVGSSYSGKVAPRLALQLHQEIRNGRIDSNFKGIAIGGPWISPISSTSSWGNFWHSMSIINSIDKVKVDRLARRFAALLETGRGGNMTAYKVHSEMMMLLYKAGIDANLYNVMENIHGTLFMRNATASSRIVNRRMKDDVMTEHSSYEKVSEILQTTNLTVICYNGQFDGIVPAIGTEAVLDSLKWYGGEEFRNAKAFYFKTPGCNSNAGFVKKYAGLSYYVVYGAGHYVFAEKGIVGIKILKDMVNDS